MKLKDLTIGTRLILAFSVFILLVTVTAAVSYNHSKRLWAFTADLYDHPLIVSRSVGDIKAGIIAMHRSMKDLILADNDTETQMAISGFKILESQVEKSFDVVYDRYLGDREDIDTSYNMFREWIAITDETMRLVRIGEVKAAEQRTKINGTGGAHIEKMMREINELVDFAGSKSDFFYTSASADKRTLEIRLLVLLISVYFLTATIAFLIVKSIRKPLKELTAVANEFRNGNYSKRSDYSSKNEIGTLAFSFNNMASTVQNDIILKENASWVSQLMMNENELRPFCKGLMNALINKTESQIAAIYLLNKKSGRYEHYESIGLSGEGIPDFSAVTAEGEFGTLFINKKIIRITNIPSDTKFVFKAVAGNFVPKEIISIPVIDKNEIVAVISLASLKNYSDLAFMLLQDIHVTITARLLGVLNYQKTKDFSEILDVQNKELDQKSKELLMQSDELKEYNIELELQKKQLDESNKLKSAFLSNMSHELRTPLNSVIALSGVLNRRLEGKIPEDEFSYLGIIEKNGKNLLTLINDILDLSRIEAGKEEITFSQFSMTELIEDIIQSLEPIFNEKGISVSLKKSVDVPEIISDSKKCRHIMQNIISNAVKFTEKGSVDISTSVLDDNIRISVKDTGIGISNEFLPFVFDEFRQADDKESRKFEGTGLGLAIVKKYCQLLNGSVSVTSIYGEGSELMVVLPLAPSDVQTSQNQINPLYDSGKRSSESALDTDSRSVTGKTILLVEDNESQIIQLNDILKDEGYNVLVAHNGREALSIISTTIPDSMILDLQMPEVDGFEVLREIRNLEETKRIPVLILTAKHITKAELSFLKENNIYQLIQKGNVNRNDLLRYIKNLTIADTKKNMSGLAGTPAEPSGNGKPHILLIEDNLDNVITLKALLEDRYHISPAKDGITGLQIASEQKPDLILLDISLPLMDGIRVLNEIKNDEKLKAIPVVALTARAMKGDREELLAHGFDGYIAKPVDNKTFEKTIQEFITAFPTFPQGGRSRS